jgi:hypothetical protein
MPDSRPTQDGIGGSLGINGAACETKHRCCHWSSGETVVPYHTVGPLRRWPNRSSSFAAFEKSLYCAIPFRQFPPDHFKMTV